MSEKPGYLNEPDLIEAIINQSLEYTPPGDKPDAGSLILAAFNVMTKRGLLNELGLEQVTRTLEHYSQRQ